MTSKMFSDLSGHKIGIATAKGTSTYSGVVQALQGGGGFGPPSSAHIYEFI